MQKVFQMNDKTFVGLTGLATDMQTLEQKFRFRCNMYRLREERDISCSAFSNMVSSLLYEKRCAHGIARGVQAAPYLSPLPVEASTETPTLLSFLLIQVLAVFLRAGHRRPR